MVKANAYGHGLKEVAQIISPKVDFFAVNTLEEALKIKNLKLKINHILVAAPIPISDLPLASKNNISLCVPSLEYLLKIKNLKLKIHLKINTGTNRLGLSLLELLPALEILRHSPNLRLEGIYTHFHSSDSGSPESLAQLDKFNQAVFQTKYYFPGCLAHCSSSSSAILWPQTHLDMIRIGISLYGLWPDDHIKKHCPPGFFLKPVLAWKCLPVQIRKMSPGETVGYSATYKYKKEGYMAILPIGYSDSYDRELSNKGRVWFAREYCQVIGRVAMNFTAIDISGCVSKSGADIPAFLTQTCATSTPSSRKKANVEPQNFVELLGPHVTADEIAKKTGTINYEVVSRLNPAIPRIIVK